MHRFKQQVLIIVGPTSSGKSALAVELARKFSAGGGSAFGGNGAEIISADSRQVYRGLDIGTGKITKREMKGVRHHLLDVASPKTRFSADDFVKKGKIALSNILQNDKMPIIVGGTGFYIDALVGRIVLPNVPPHQQLRTRLEKKTAAQLFAMLKQRDPRRAKTIEPQHKRRLIRALEIAASIGKSPPTARQGLAVYDTLWIGLTPPTKELEKKITIRLFARLRGARSNQSRGMVAEGRRLHAGGLSYKRMEELGLEYRSLAHFLQGKITRGQMIEELDRAIRKYAKRQLTYWKRNKDIQWFNGPRAASIPKLIYGWLRG